MERDYNAFSLADEPYSQGNGNYRDVNQNRRSDVLLNPAVKAFNLISFLGLIQADGYNPLVVLGSRFTVEPARRAKLQQRLGLPDSIMALLAGTFTPGSVLRAIQDQGLALPLSWDELLVEILAQAQQHFEADFGEGFWADHWTYNMDLVENYAAVYPERHDGSALWPRPRCPSSTARLWCAPAPSAMCWPKAAPASSTPSTKTRRKKP